MEIEANVDALYELAEMSLDAGKTNDAIDQLRRGLDVFPDSPKLNLKLGQILANLIINNNDVLETEDNSVAIG